MKKRMEIFLFLLGIFIMLVGGGMRAYYGDKALANTEKPASHQSNKQCYYQAGLGLSGESMLYTCDLISTSDKNHSYGKIIIRSSRIKTGDLKVTIAVIRKRGEPVYLKEIASDKIPGHALTLATLGMINKIRLFK